MMHIIYTAEKRAEREVKNKWKEVRTDGKKA
jgi:hypothetical protein